MWATLMTTVNAVAPIILLILLGYLLKRCGFLNQSFVKTGNKLVFRVCLPCMLFINIYDSLSSFSDIRWDVVLYCVAVIAVIFVFGLITAILTTKQADRRGVIAQCVFRSNFAIIGFSLAERLNGDTAVVGIVSAFSISLFNILAVIALTVFIKKDNPAVAAAGENPEGAPEGGEASAAKVNFNKKAKSFARNAGGILLDIVKNPLIIAVFTGLVFVGIRGIESVCTGLPAESVPFRFDNQLKFLYTVVKDLKAIASPFALIVLGGQFEFTAVKGMTKEIVVASLWRIIIVPLIGIGGAYLLSALSPAVDFGPEIYPTFVALFGTPVAVSSAIMAGEMHNDGQLAAQLVVWTSLGSIVTISATVFILLLCGQLIMFI